MKKSLWLLLPLFSLTLSSCSSTFEMINEGDHGDVFSGGSSQNPVERKDVDSFIDEAKKALDSDEYKKYDSKGSNVYLETTSKEKDEPNLKTTSVALIKDNTSLTSTILEKGDNTKKHITYTDASDQNKIRILIDNYINNDEVKKYISEESYINGDFEHLYSYHDTARMSYLDNMEYLLNNFDLMYHITCIFNDSLDETLQCINCYKGEAYIKQNKETITYKFFSFNLQHEKMNSSGEIYFTGDYDIKKMSIKFNDKEEGSSSSAYMSLLPYDKDIKPLSAKNRSIVSPADVEKLINEI